MSQEDFALARLESDDDRVYYVLVKHFNRGVDGFEITVCDGSQAWRKSVSVDDIESMAKKVEMETVDYVDQTLKALTGSGSENFVYQVDERQGNLLFSWKKKIGDSIKLGSLSLHKVKDSVVVVSGMFDLAIKQMAELKNEISSLRSDNDRLSSERSGALKRLEKYVVAKEEMEKDLYHKFTIVLNDKKSKIRKLKDEVKKMAEGSFPTQDQQGAEVGSEEMGSRTRREESCDAEKTDDGCEFQRSATRSDSSERDCSASCLLLPKDEEEVAPTVKRRRRREPATKETSTKKLILPKVSLTKKTSNASSSSTESPTTPRLRKRITSDKVEPDADDLMAEMEM